MVKKSAYNGPRNSRIKRQRARRRKKMMIRAGAAALCLAAVIGAVSGIRTLVGGHKTKNQEHITSMEETLPQKLKEINGISVKGLGYEETVAALIKGYDWNLSVSYEGKTEKLNNLIEARTRQYLDEICTQNMEGSYTFDLLDVSELAKEEAGLPESGIRSQRTVPWITMTRPVGSLYFAVEKTAWSLTRKNWQRISVRR